MIYDPGQEFQMRIYILDVWQFMFRLGGSEWGLMVQLKKKQLSILRLKNMLLLKTGNI